MRTKVNGFDYDPNFDVDDPRFGGDPEISIVSVDTLFTEKLRLLGLAPPAALPPNNPAPVIGGPQLINPPVAPAVANQNYAGGKTVDLNKFWSVKMFVNYFVLTDISTFSAIS